MGLTGVRKCIFFSLSLSLLYLSLQSMAASGKTIIATIHQPSSEIFAMFNDLYIMGEGKLCFAGSIGDAADFFARSRNNHTLNFLLR